MSEEPTPKRPREDYEAIANPGGKGAVPYILAHDANATIAFLETVFGATVQNKMAHPEVKEKVMHSALTLEGKTVFVSDSNIKGPARDPPANQAPHSGDDANPSFDPTVALYVELADAKETFAKAIENGASSVMECKLQFWGDVFGSFSFQGTLFQVSTPGKAHMEGKKD